MVSVSVETCLSPRLQPPLSVIYVDYIGGFWPPVIFISTAVFILSPQFVCEWLQAVKLGL